MQTDEISHLLSRDPLMCRTYDVVAKYYLSDIIVDTYPAAIVCNTHDSDRPGEHWVAMYVDTERRGDYFDPYGLEPQHIEFTNFMTEHCSEWAPNDRTLQSPMSTVCGQYCVAFLMFRCRDASMNAFTRLFTTDFVANDCRVFDCVAAVNKKMMMCCSLRTRSYIICQRTCTGHNCNDIHIYIYKITNTAVTTQFVYYPTKYTIYD